MELWTALSGPRQTVGGMKGGGERDGVMDSRGRGEEKRGRPPKVHLNLPVCDLCWCLRGRMRRCGPRLQPVASLAPHPIGKCRSSSCWPSHWRWRGYWTLTSLEEEKESVWITYGTMCEKWLTTDTVKATIIHNYKSVFDDQHVSTALNVSVLKKRRKKRVYLCLGK